MTKKIQENMPKDEDGCSVRSWRCEDPNREEMENGRSDGTTLIQVRKECKRCPVCMMIFCKQHMSNPEHMRDCNFRSNQERELLTDQRAALAQKEVDRQKKEGKEAKEKAEFEAKERIRRKTISDRNRKFKSG